MLRILELKEAMLLVGIVACLFSIARTIWTFYGESICAAVGDLASLLSN
jgi:hypothetical protein